MPRPRPRPSQCLSEAQPQPQPQPPPEHQPVHHHRKRENGSPCHHRQHQRQRSASPARQSRRIRHTGGRLNEPTELYTSAVSEMPSSSSSFVAVTGLADNAPTPASSAPPALTKPSRRDDHQSRPTSTCTTVSSSSSSTGSTHRTHKHVAKYSITPSRHCTARTCLSPAEKVPAPSRVIRHRSLPIDHPVHRVDCLCPDDLMRQKLQQKKQHHAFVIRAVDDQVPIRTQQNLVRLVELAQTPVAASNAKQHVSILIARKALRYRGLLRFQSE